MDQPNSPLFVEVFFWGVGRIPGGNAHKLIRICEQFHHWAETRFLYRHNDEFDNAIKVMMKHTAEAWEHEIFKDILTKVKGTTRTGLSYKGCQRREVYTVQPGLGLGM